ncbi:unnamed protein product [Blepharisma stoltei]|uniref:FRIGIDA-like protein n=1 Tax=Blepharisma stoltei TaxID=1481888 RepID=A0AAU9JJV1_9CILI|nr:unnamed protein product [Blepharisma stoltei]
MLNKTTLDNSTNTTRSGSTPKKQLSMCFERSPIKHQTNAMNSSGIQDFYCFSPINSKARISWEPYSDSKKHLSPVRAKEGLNLLNFKNEKLKIEVERDRLKQHSRDIEIKLSEATDQISQLKAELEYKDEMLKHLSKLVEEREEKFKDLFSKETCGYQEIIKQKESIIKDLKSKIQKYKKSEIRRKETIKAENDCLNTKIDKIIEKNDECELKTSLKTDESLLLEFAEDIDLFVSSIPLKAKSNIRKHPEILSIIDQIGELKQILLCVMKGEKIPWKVLMDHEDVTIAEDSKKKTLSDALNDLCEIRKILSDIYVEGCGSKSAV